MRPAPPLQHRRDGFRMDAIPLKMASTPPSGNPERPRIVLHERKTKSVVRRHPWIFSGAIKTRAPGVVDGDVVDVFGESGQFLATGHYASGSIAVRLFSFTPVKDLDRMWTERLAEALHYRNVIGLANSPLTNAYRLVNAEGDGLPGLVIDWYAGTAVFQAHSLGMYRERDRVAQGLREVFGSSMRGLFDRSAAALHGRAGGLQDGYLMRMGDGAEVIIKENGLRFKVDWETGQKTGFFLDQRDNRALLGRYAERRDVLNVFCYSGGFSAYAAAAGARSIQSLDSSAAALNLAEENVAMNNPNGVPHSVIRGDAFQYLTGMEGGAIDLMVLDPPAFAKGLSSRHSAVQAYRRLNELALKKIRKGGLLFSFSCSQVVTPDLFSGAVTAAAIASGRSVRVLHEMGQPSDHPVSIYHPEGRYLKGLVLYVD